MLDSLPRPLLAVKILSSLALLCAAGTLWAQAERDGDSDLLDQARRRQLVAAQKLETEVRRALQDAERLARISRTQAAACLKKALAQLDEERLLSPERRQSLQRLLRERLRSLESDTARGQAGAADQEKTAPRPIRGAEASRGTPDPEITRQSLQTRRQLQGEGTTAAALHEANALAGQYPPDSAALAADKTTRTAEHVANARRLQRERERHLLSGYDDVEKSATLPNGDFELPKDWKERTKGRTAAIALTAKEKSILQALNKTISVNFKNSKLEDVIDCLQTYTGQAILLDREGMKDAEVSYETTITLTVKGVAVRTVLRKILGDLGMTYVIKDEAIQATSAQKAREMMVVRRYYVGDLLAGMGGLGPLGRLQAGFWNPGIVPGGVPNFSGLPFGAVANPQLQALQQMESVKQLIELIQTSVDPQSWQANGGSGTITFHAPSMSLLIKQSAEVHALLGSSGLLQ